MVKLQYITPPSDSEEIIAEVVEDEPPRRERKPRGPDPRDQRIAELERENAALLAACDRLNRELAIKDQQIAALQSQPTDTAGVDEVIVLVEALLRRLGLLKMNGKTGILAEIRFILEKLRQI